MRSSIALAILAGSHAAFASPVHKRQATSRETALPVPTDISLAPSAASSVIESVTSEIVATSATVASSGSAALPSASASASATPTYGFTCESPYLLTYVERQQNFDSALDAVLSFAGQWSDATYLGETSNDGMGNMVGANRTVQFPIGIAVNETLTNYTQNAATSAVYQVWNSTGGLSVMNISVANYTTEQQIYSNDTAPGETTVKLFTNMCAIDQAGAQGLLSDYFGFIFQNITTGLGNTSASGASSAVGSATNSGFASATVAPSALSSGSVVASATFSSATAAASGSLTINTPAALTECQPAALTFFGGQAPYFLEILPAGQVSATPLEQFPQQSSAGSYTWTVNIASGTAITIAIRDGTGLINYSAPVTIQAGTSTSCISA